MTVTAEDIRYFLSGGGSNTDPNNSLGGESSVTQVTLSPTLNNLFDNVTPEEALSGVVDFRCIYVVNYNSLDSLLSGKIWISANTPSADTLIAIGLDPAGIGDGESTGVATTIADELTPPSGVTFTSPSDELSSLEVGAMGPDESFALWVRRTVLPSAEPVSSDPFTLTFKGTPET